MQEFTRRNSIFAEKKKIRDFLLKNGVFCDFLQIVTFTGNFLGKNLENRRKKRVFSDF